MKRIYLIGARGRLGQAIAREYADADVVILDRSLYEAWSRDGAEREITRYFERQAGESLIFVTSGLLDPRLPAESLQGVNFHLPKNLIAAVSPLGMRVVTFGTVMEAFPGAQNAYVESKRRLNEYVNTSVRAGGTALHLQIHTLYGLGAPTPFMFLGQILDAIRRSAPFPMTSGRQLREYHHLEDEARAIRWLAESTASGTIALSHGSALTLRDIAVSVFEGLGKSELLKVGAIADPVEENFERIFEPVLLPAAIKFRESLPAIVEYMKSCLSEKPNQTEGLGQ
ncbi:NAD-dependent epimerase/dehydratase family protein [Paraburkholderia nodosa]|uniref:NAD-dependent epimerase/dehydratase family protein n=1 Tax=Paraburkholderia nodosa TaxID=392320 RepID=UPI0004BC9B8A|nr:NAD(P)-dependent oxidoreductase [Paraburkholderia nodosa]